MFHFLSTDQPIKVSSYTVKYVIMKGYYYGTHSFRSFVELSAVSCVFALQLRPHLQDYNRVYKCETFLHHIYSFPLYSSWIICEICRFSYDVVTTNKEYFLRRNKAIKHTRCYKLERFRYSCSLMNKSFVIYR